MVLCRLQTSTSLPSRCPRFPPTLVLESIQKLNAKLLNRCHAEGRCFRLFSLFVQMSSIVLFYKYVHISKIMCCCGFKTQHFRCVQIICTFYKSVCTEITMFFHFFRSIASCDHQMTSEGQLLRPFSLLLTILMFS